MEFVEHRYKRAYAKMLIKENGEEDCFSYDSYEYLCGELEGYRQILHYFVELKYIGVDNGKTDWDGMIKESNKLIDKLEKEAGKYWG